MDKLDSTVLVALIGSLGLITVALINRKRDPSDKLKDELESHKIRLANSRRENLRLRLILAAKDLRIDALISQLKRHAPGVNPAPYHPPEEENKI